VLTCACFGCGDDDDDGAVADAAVIDAANQPDAAQAPDAAPPDAGPLQTDNCPVTYGPTGVSSTFQVAEGTVGFDLNGDGTIDNAIGGTGVRGVLNGNFNTSLGNGSLRSLAEIRDLGAIGTDDPEIAVVLYGGVDSDDPAEGSDDFTGDESYYFAHDGVNSVTCDPRALAAANYTGGVVSAEDESIKFYVESFGGFLTIVEPRVSATIEADTTGYKTAAGTPALMGGAIPTCSLQNGDSGGFGQNALHALVQFFDLQPDIDVDGDGPETIQSQSLVIESCTDGDGTVIPGETCGCDPRMKDAFSIAFETDIVGATLLGPEPVP
jgi:hypothetical protein